MSERRRIVHGALLIWAAATLIEATILAAQEGLFLPFALIGSGVNYAILGLLAVPVWRLCARVRRRRTSKWRAGAGYAGALLALLALWQGIYFGLFYLLAGKTARAPWEAGGLWYLLGAVMTCGLVIAGIVLAQTSRELRQRAEREARLELSAREAEVRALRAQLRPHFFFNVLNSIYSLIETRPREAQQMVDRVAQLMRQTLEAADDESVPLAWELDSVRTYLAIEEVRLGDRLEVIYDVDDALGEVAVPPLLLQPVVENAIQHGVAPRAGGGRVEIGVRREDGGRDGERVVLAVRDTGSGLADGAGDPDDGRGLGITRRRLEVLYPERHALELRNLEPTGFEVAIRIPATPAGAGTGGRHA